MKNESSYIYCGNPDTHASWEFIPNTVEARIGAIERGMNAFTVYSMEHEPPTKEQKNAIKEPNRYGDFWLDIDDKKDPANAIASARLLMTEIASRTRDVDLRAFYFYLSGSKGCHIRIPAEIFGGEDGDPYLPLIHKEFLRGILKHYFKIYVPSKQQDWGVFDINMYKMGKGQLVREKDIQRKDGKFKVEVSVQTFMEENIPYLLERTNNNTVAEIEHVPPVRTDLVYLYRKAITMQKLLTRWSPFSNAINGCDFVMDCIVNSWGLADDKWNMFLRIIKTLDPRGKEYAHAFSEHYEKYRQSETEYKFNTSKSLKIPYCEEVKRIYDCPENCKCSHTLKLDKNTTEGCIRIESFDLREDGLYFSKSQGESDDYYKISSPLKIIGKIKNRNDRQWGRVIEVTNPEGKTTRMVIEMKECVGRGEMILARLYDAGLEMYSRKDGKYILDYITLYPTQEILTKIDSLGWYEDKFILPDTIYGDSERKALFYEDNASLFTQNGTFEEWLEHIGNYAAGNSLLMFTMAFALIGPLLKPCNVEGGGLHIYGLSSSGKSTVAMAAGSVCGGSVTRGFVKQWRSTANALERTAFGHNDLLLVLDEIGQATSDAVANVAYMLSNGQARERMKSDTSLRHTLEWTVSFLSTGEIAMSDKIEEYGKNKTMAGQEVRIINIPIDAGKGTNIFINLHGWSSPAELSRHFKEAAKLYWGTALREFLECLFGSSNEDLANNIKTIKSGITDFVKKYVPQDACGQVIRVAIRFGLIAHVGRFATENGIFPWTPDEAEAVAREWFEVWLEQRGGHKDFEISRATQGLDEFIEAYGQTRFICTDSTNEIKRIHNLSGYKTEDGEYTNYYFIPKVFREIVGSRNMKTVINHLIATGQMVMERDGKDYKKFKQVYDADANKVKNQRIIGIRYKHPETNDASIDSDVQHCNYDVIKNEVF